MGKAVRQGGGVMRRVFKRSTKREGGAITPRPRVSGLPTGTEVELLQKKKRGGGTDRICPCPSQCPWDLHGDVRRRGRCPPCGESTSHRGGARSLASPHVTVCGVAPSLLTYQRWYIPRTSRITNAIAIWRRRPNSKCSTAPGSTTDTPAC